VPSVKFALTNVPTEVYKRGIVLKFVPVIFEVIDAKGTLQLDPLVEENEE